MNRVELAIRTFLWIFLNKRFAEKVEQFFTGKKPEIEEPRIVPVKVVEEKRRSEAVQIVALMQREGRLVDFLKEPIDTYSDAQVGAAVRDVHRDCATVLDRVFKVEPLMLKDEGASVSVLPGFDPEQYHLTGNVSGNPPYEGVLRHHGWRADKVELPVWKGNEDSADVLAPAEVEL